MRERLAHDGKVSICTRRLPLGAAGRSLALPLMKKLPLSLLALGVALLAGCAKKSETASTAAATPSAPAKVKIGFLVKQPEEPWFQYEWKGSARAAAKNGFEVVQLGVPDGEKVLAAIDTLAAGGAQGFVICTPDVRLGPAIMAKAKNAKLKVVTVDDQFVGANGQFMTDVPYLGMSASKIGESVGVALLGEMKKRNWAPADTGVCVVTFEELETAKQRTEGAISALKAGGFPAAQIYKTPQKYPEIPQAMAATDTLLAQHPKVKHWLVCGMNDNTVLGAIRSMEGAKFGADNVIGIGINGTDCINELSKASPTGFYGSMLVSAPQEGYDTSEMLYKWVKDGTTPALDTRTVGIFITRENFREVLKREGITE